MKIYLKTFLQNYPLPRGQTRLLSIVDRIYRRNAYRDEEVIDKIGDIYFPFLPTAGHAMLYWGLYEIPNVKLLRRLLKEGDIFIDAGANVGYISAIALSCVGIKGNVHAFEPNYSHFKRLLLLSDLNPAYSFMASHVAIDSMAGMVSLNVSNHSGWHSIIPDFNTKNVNSTSQEIIPSISLDDYFEHHNLLEPSAVKCIKIDVEGAELNALKGCKKILAKRAANNFLIEISPSSSFGSGVKSDSQVLSIMNKAGYIAYNPIEVIKNRYIPLEIDSVQVQSDILFSSEALL